MTLGEESYTRHKNRVKRARTLVEIAFVIAALYLLYTLFFHGKTYERNSCHSRDLRCGWDRYRL